MNVAQALSIALSRGMEDRVREIMRGAPRGIGIYVGTASNDKSTPKKIIFNASYNHIYEAAFFRGWMDYKVIITSSFDGMDIKVTGNDYNAIKDYITDVLLKWLNDDYQWQK